MTLRKAWAEISAKWNIHDIPVEDHLRQTNQERLPQTKLLIGSLKHLEEEITEAYLRGSFSLGEADEHSDIDLFLVVEPENLENTYDAFLDYVNENYEVLVVCHDRLVKDYGGIGFMFVIKDEDDKLFQFDLYMAMKGVPPKAHLYDCPRIYTQDPEYCWLGESRGAELPEQTQAFIEHHTSGNTVTDELEYQMVDLMVALNIMKKHLIRGQNARALGDNAHAIGVCIEMLRALYEDKSVHTPLYAGDKILQACSEDDSFKEVGGALKDAILEPPSLQQVIDLYEIGSSIIRDQDPDLYLKMEKAITEYDKLVISPVRHIISRPDLKGTSSLNRPSI